jgi:hypothetical protein
MHRPYVLGTVPRVPLVGIDPPKQVFEGSYGGHALVAEVQSNHNALGAIYSTNPTAGTVTITSGALSGTYSATVTANNFWNSALLFPTSGTGTGVATINRPVSGTPAGSITMGCQVRADFTQNALRYAMGWQTGNSAGSIILRTTTGAVNRLNVFVINDAAAVFQVSIDGFLIERRTTSIACRLNVATQTLTLFVDGVDRGSVATSGTFATTRPTFGLGCRGDTLTNSWIGRIDDPWVVARAMTDAEIMACHLLPFASTITNLTYGWHLDDGSTTSSMAATTAASALGGTALTLTNVTWTRGRSAAADLARKCYYKSGLTAAALDTTSWAAAITDNPSDCGWFVSAGQSTEEILGIILGGLGFVRYKVAGIIYLRRFEGVTGVPETSYSAELDLQAAPIEPGASDPPVWEWRVDYNTNNTPMDKATVAAALATSDPDRYEYATMERKTAVRNDYSIKRTAAGVEGRFPLAVSLSRLTALISERDAYAEATRLLALHRHSSIVQQVPMYLLAGSVLILSEVEVVGVEAGAFEEGDTWVIIGLAIEDDNANVVLWRPSI